MEKRFSLIFLAIFGAVLILYTALSFWLHPFVGDLTRTGGFTENQFGWNKPQIQFESDSSLYFSSTTHPKYTDIVVFGDSFSHSTRLGKHHVYGWQNFLAEKTGYSISTYHINETDIFKWIKNLSSSNNAPKFIIYQQVQRNFSKPNQLLCDSMNLPNNAVNKNFGILKNPSNGIETIREKSKPFSFETGIHWLKINIENKGRTLKLPLVTDNLFSSSNKNNILILDKDEIVRKRKTSKDDAHSAACLLHRLRYEIDKLKDTKLIAFITPDKATAYEEHIDFSGTIKNPSIYELLDEINHPIFRTDIYFKQLIDKGIVDLYLPNDTHWGSDGNRYFASLVNNAIENTQ